MPAGIILLGIGIGITISIITCKIKKWHNNKYTNNIAEYYSYDNYNLSQSPIPKKGVISLDNINGTMTESEDGDYTEL